MNSVSGKAFNNCAYTVDGRCIITGGNSKYVVIYDICEGAMVKKFQISQNLNLNGVEEFLDSWRVTEVGNINLINDCSNESCIEDCMDMAFSGA